MTETTKNTANLDRLEVLDLDRCLEFAMKNSNTNIMKLFGNRNEKLEYEHYEVQLCCVVRQITPYENRCC